jgi:DNA ligase (NAD+)
LVNLKRLYLRAKEAYYNSTDGVVRMSDKVFDALEALIKDEDPKWSGLKKVGAPVKTVVGKKVERTLPVPMASLNKVKADAGPNALRLRLAQFTGNKVVIGPKYDGSAVQGSYVLGKLTALNTRGNGTLGKSLDHFITHLGGALPTTLPTKWTGIVRCEAIVPLSVWKAKYSKEFETARAMSSAILNRQDVHPALTAGDVHFVVLRVLSDGPTRIIPSISDGLAKAARLGFHAASWVDYTKAEVTHELLVRMASMSEDWDVDYRLDGLVVFQDHVNLRCTATNPAYGFAFKLDEDEDEAAQATILSIEHSVTRTKRVVPVAILTPTVFDDGTTVSRATLNNVPWARDQKAGVGSVVSVIRGGEIIPKVIAVKTPKPYAVPTAASLGVVSVAIQGKDMVVVDIGEGDVALNVREQAFSFAIKTIGMKHLAGSAAVTLAEVYEDPLEMIADFYRPGVFEEKVKDTIGVKTARRALTTLPKTIPLWKLMRASGVFGKGLGSTLLERLFTTAPTSARKVGSKFQVTYSRAKAIEVLGPVAGTNYADKEDAFYTMYLGMDFDIPLDRTVAAAKTVVSGRLTGKVFCFTGYRDFAQKTHIESLGGVVSDKFDKSVTHLLHREGGRASTKLEKARASGISVLTFTQV